MKLATDITCLERLGLDAWLESFRWPISQPDFQRLTDLIHGLWEQACHVLEGDDRDVMMSENVPAWLMQIAHAALAAAAVRGAGGELLLGRMSESYYRPDWNGLGSAYSHVLAQSAGRLTARRWLRNLGFNRELPLLRRAAALFRADAVALGSNDALRARYVRWHRWGVDNTYIPLLAAGARPEPLAPALRREAEGLAEAVCSNLAGRFQASLDGDGLRRALAARLAMLMGVHRQVRRRARAVPLLVTESAKPLHKVAACAWRSGTGTTVGFHHGHAVGELKLPARAYGEFYAYDEFACPSQVSAEAFAADYAATPLAAHGSPRFVVPDGVAEGRAATGPSPAFPRRVRRVMIMGYPMNATRYLRHGGLFWAPQLELEIRLARLLIRGGFEVLYKVHPERPQPVSSIMSSIGCRVVPERFEQVADMADAIVVKYIFSSTFPTVLASDRPVYLIDTERALWNPAYRDLLARRCTIIPAAVEADGRIGFDEQALLTGLAGEQSMPDYSYVDKYYPSR